MVIQKNINIKDDKLLNGLIPVFDIIDQIEKSDDDEITIDFGNKGFFSPLFVLPLMVYLDSSKRKISCANVSPYLAAAHFPYGIMADKMTADSFRGRLNSYLLKTYIPIVNFPATKQYDAEKGDILTCVESIIEGQLKLQSNVISGLKYMLGESIDNITEHSESHRGYIFAQAYPTKRYLDVCIADTGITLLGSYKKQAGNEIESDIEAIQAANRGISTKNLPDAENRGYGIITSKRMLTEGLGGHYIMLSGDALHLKTKELNNYLQLPRGIRWEGTIIALRIPYNNNAFNYVNYLE